MKRLVCLVGLVLATVAVTAATSPSPRRVTVEVCATTKAVTPTTVWMENSLSGPCEQAGGVVKTTYLRKEVERRPAKVGRKGDSPSVFVNVQSVVKQETVPVCQTNWGAETPGPLNLPGNWPAFEPKPLPPEPEPVCSGQGHWLPNYSGWYGSDSGWYSPNYAGWGPNHTYWDNVGVGYCNSASTGYNSAGWSSCGYGVGVGGSSYIGLPPRTIRERTYSFGGSVGGVGVISSGGGRWR